MSLILHRGGALVTRIEIDSIPVPQATDTHRPVPFGTLIDATKDALDKWEFRVSGMQHALAKAGQRYFGLFDIDRGGVDTNAGYRFKLGLRASYDKAFALAWVIGSNVFVCDNLSFSGDMKIAHKFTAKVLEKIPSLLLNACASLLLKVKQQDAQFLRYKQLQISDRIAAEVITQLYRENIVPLTKLGAVMDEWYEPRHQEHKDEGKSVWRLFNATTEALKDENPANVFALADRTPKLAGLLDRVVLDQTAVPVLAAA